jgi:lysophospholipase L1-like esterase
MQKINDTQAGFLTNESVNQPKTYVAFGDSITDGYNATSVPNEYPSLIAANKGLNLTNKGLSGMRINDPAMIDNMYAEVVDNTKIYTILPGVNDARTAGTDTTLIDSFRGCLQAGLAWLAIPDAYKVKAANATKTGTWAVNTGVYGSMDYQSSTNGSTMSAKVKGTTAYVGHIRSIGTAGTFTVSIDGVSMGTFSTAVNTPTRQVGGGQYGAYLLRFPGLSYGEHTVTVTVTSASGNVYIDWFGGNGFPYDPKGPAVYSGNCLRASDAYYTANPPHSEAGVAAHNLVINDAVNSLARDGLNVVLVDVVSSQDRADYTDGLHPNDAGMVKLANAFLLEMSSYSKPNDKGVLAIKSTPWQLATLLNSWVNFDAAGTGFYEPAFMKDETGRVWLRGLAKSGTIGTNAIFKLPPGFRPGMQMHITTASNAAGGTIGVIEILPDGTVRAPVGNTAYVSFDNISFLAEQ